MTDISSVTDFHNAYVSWRDAINAEYQSFLIPFVMMIMFFTPIVLTRFGARVGLILAATIVVESGGFGVIMYERRKHEAMIAVAKTALEQSCEGVFNSIADGKVRWISNQVMNEIESECAQEKLIKAANSPYSVLAFTSEK